MNNVKFLMWIRIAVLGRDLNHDNSVFKKEKKMEAGYVSKSLSFVQLNSLYWRCWRELLISAAFF